MDSPFNLILSLDEQTLADLIRNLELPNDSDPQVKPFCTPVTWDVLMQEVD